ncbi:hypothetical protein EHS13_05845 [Paenibacillus psychroresistens]|uniref:Uncharacterized protein n=1 Tax=Paenibacillus psychroresistens TaxID=1778678 RepID=A0A6B8RGB1_9BACL|nr:hypothetical protein [Paenibacillus psychroresistens]QGQ94458.1 hypothetical protein EHS13_05845 [Paenibacillus psychroresistens]
MKPFQTRIGIQSSVMAWDDPWHEAACKHLMRTGEGKWFPSQDHTPSKAELFSLIKSLGADFYLHSVMPNDDEIEQFIDDISQADIDFMLNNEFGVINGPYLEGTNRYDVSAASVDRAVQSGKFLGLIYDETEHLQLHPNQYRRMYPKEMAKGTRHQWTSTEGKSLQQVEDEVAAAVHRQTELYGQEAPMYSEQVFPVMYHTLSRGGMNPCPKVLKEEFQSLQLSTALGAAKQYKRQMGICVDLWGPDVGSWFTRLWGFPGHSPREYQSALEMAYLMGPAMMFTENIDPLAVFQKNGFMKTEFGDIFEQFIKKFVPEHPRYYDHSMIEPDIVLIRSDDTDIALTPASGVASVGGQLFGSADLPGNMMSQSAFQAFHLLSRGSLPANGNTFFLPQYEYPASRYSRNELTLQELPLHTGIEKGNETKVHGLFYPLNNVAVYDEHVDGSTLGTPKLIIIAGSRMTGACLKSVSQKVREGAVCVAAEWLMPEGFRTSRSDGLGRWIITKDFLDGTVAEQVEPFLGERNCWRQRFGEYEVSFYNDNKDGITLTHSTKRS